MSLTKEQSDRYNRHILLQEIGTKGQEKINNGKVLVIGAGGLGSPNLLYLAAAGVGTLGVIDGDRVDLSNLQRQIIHTTQDLDRPKAISAKESINQINPDVKVLVYEEFLSTKNAKEILSDYDFIIDGTDNSTIKFLINDICVEMGKPFSHGGVLRFEGQTMTYLPGHACYRCLFPVIPGPESIPTCSQNGILGTVPGILGSLQASEALKFLTGTGHLLTDKLLHFDVLTMNFHTLHIKKNPKCPICGNEHTSSTFSQ